MRSLISALAAAGLLMFTLSCYSADEPYTGQSKAEKPGRAVAEERQRQVQARPEQARPHRRGKAGSQGRRSSREPRPHGREEVSGIQGPLKAPGKKGSDFVWVRSSATPPGSGRIAPSRSSC